MEDPPLQPPPHPLAHLVIGYPKLAGQMELIPQVAIFRRFGALNARNLLYYQAELTDLEKRLVEKEKKDNDAREVGKKERYALDWFWLKNSNLDGDTEQLKLVMKIRKTLKEYNMWDMKDLQIFLDSETMGSLALLGDDSKIWGSVTEPHSFCQDLIVLRPRLKEDPFSDWLAEFTMKWLSRLGLTRFLKVSPVHGEPVYQDTKIFEFTWWISGILASLIPLGSVVVLYVVHSMRTRLIVIGAFNLFISFCLMVFTNAKRSEIFAVSCAFTAVQVVFINTGSSK